MNEKLFKPVNLLLFKLDRMEHYNGGWRPYFRVESHRLWIVGWHPICGAYQATRVQATRVHAILSWLGNVWDDFFK